MYRSTRPVTILVLLALSAAGCGTGATPGDTGQGERGITDGGGGSPDGGGTTNDGSAAGDGGSSLTDATFAFDANVEDAGTATQPSPTHFLDAGALLGSIEDPGWFLANIPFFEAPDPQIQATYYYRWETYKEHLAYTGPEYGYVTTEFLEPSSYGAPYGGVVAAAGHHISEGRWLRNEQYVKDDINYWLNGPGQFPKAETEAVNPTTADWAHEYSFWAASAVWQQYLATGDLAFTSGQQPALIRQYAGWANHFDSTLGLYWQVPVWDATEYSASSYESSDPYHGGAGYRPTITAYQYGDAEAIAHIANLTGDTATAATYTSLANALQASMQQYLWDPTRNFFYDMPLATEDGGVNATNALLDSREEMGFVPWMFDMPQASDAIQFQELLDADGGFAAAYGPTTVERRSEWFMYQALTGCCHWDGPSWPYETSQTLTGLANLLDDYPAQTVVTASDYLNALHTYAATQFENGASHLGQAHDPDNDDWIYEGDDYNHSTFNDNVISGLVGLRGQPDETLVVQPLAPASWAYFALENAPYHGHEITVLWDSTGARYGQGAGMHVYVDGSQAVSQADLGAVTVSVGPANAQSNALAGIDVASNSQRLAYGTQPMASYTFSTDNVWNGVDGTVFRVGIAEDTRWTSYSSTNASDYYGVNFQRDVTFDYVWLSFYDDGMGVLVPSSYDLQYWVGGAWASVPNLTRTPNPPVGNARTEISFPPVTTTQLRVVAPNAGGNVGWGLSEVWVRSKPIFNIVNVNSNLLLAMNDESQDAGGQAQQYENAGTPDQLWELVGAGSGYYEIMNVNSGLVLAPAGMATTDSALVQQFSDSSGPFSLWTLIDDSANGQFKIKNEGSGLLLGVSGESTANSANVVQFEDNGTPDHLWMFESANDPQLSYDDFTDNSTSQWSPVTGSWSLCQPAMDEEYCSTSTAESLTLTGQAAWRSYTVDALLRADAAALGASAGIVARAEDATHYYLAEVTHNPDGTQGWDISKNDGGTWTKLAAGSHVWIPATPGQIDIRFSAAGGYLTMGIVGPSGAISTLGSVYDTEFSGGQVGLRTSGLTCSFDDVRVTAG